jgi:hypothetical protein
MNDYFKGELMSKIKTILAVAVLLGATVASAANNLNIIVAGAKGGNLQLSSNLLANDAKNNLLNGQTISLTEPGNACKGFAEAVKQQDKETFLIPVENLYLANAQVKNDPLCPLPDFIRARPVYTEAVPYYLVARKAVSFTDLKSRAVAIGYSSDSQLEKNWHQSMNQSFQQQHRFVGYQGTSGLINGMLAKDIDVIWTSLPGFNRLEKTAPGEFVLLSVSSSDPVAGIAPIASLLANQSLSRMIVTTWWLFNEQPGQSLELSRGLEKLYRSGSGEWGRWVVENKKDFVFDPKQQLKEFYGHPWSR